MYMCSCTVHVHDVWVDSWNMFSLDLPNFHAFPVIQKMLTNIHCGCDYK